MNMPQSADADAWTESMLDCYRDVLTRVLNMEWRLSENQRAELFSRLRTSLDCYRVLNTECLSKISGESCSPDCAIRSRSWRTLVEQFRPKTGSGQCGMVRIQFALRAVVIDLAGRSEFKA